MNGYVKDMMCDSNNDVHYYSHDHVISHEHDIHVHNNNHNGFQSFSHVDNDCLKNNFDTIDWHSNGHEQLMSQYVTQDANQNQNQAQYQTLFALNNESEIQPSSCSPPSQPIMNAHAHKPMKTSNLKSKSSSSKKSNTNKKELTHKLPKPVSAYALFFRDAQALIKGSNPNASFGEISKVVASNWENLDKVNKDIYKHRADQEKKNYLKSLASSRAKMVAGMMENAGKQSNVINDDGNHGQHDGDHAPVDTPVGSSSTHNDSQQQIPSSNTHASEGTNFENENEERNDLEIVAHSLQTNNSNVCIRSGCGKPAIESQEWDNEYCSSECCVKHCSDVFNAWVAEQQQQQQLQQQQQANQAQ